MRILYLEYLPSTKHYAILFYPSLESYFQISLINGPNMFGDGI